MFTEKRAMKRIMAMVLGLGLLSSPVWAATDYSSKTNEELAALRGSMRELSQEERDAFRTEWQSRVNSMTQEERQQAVGRPENAVRDGAGMQNGARKGQAKGKADFSMRGNAPASGAGNANSGNPGGGRGMGRNNR